MNGGITPRDIPQILEHRERIINLSEIKIMLSVKDRFSRFREENKRWARILCMLQEKLEVPT